MSNDESVPLGDVTDAELAQRRLRDLLRANSTVVERLDLEIVLRRIVEAAMSLVNARYGALGVIAPDGSLERFIQVGIDADHARRIGHPPTGIGLIGAVMTERVPIRLAYLAQDPRFAGFPDHHPAMRAFLGVPVRVGEQVYGNLYLAQGGPDPFTAADEELVVALAATAGIAIENARLYDSSKTRELWSAAAADVMSAMLDLSGQNVLDVVADHVSTVVRADCVAVAVPHGDDEFQVTAARGPGSEPMRGRIFAAEASLASRALTSRLAVSTTDGGDPSAADWPAGSGPTVAIPLISEDEALGVLTISRRPSTPAFTEADLEMAQSFARQASVAIEIVRAREDRRRLDTAHDRARIARDLHDHVIQRLFAAGLSLQAVSATVDADASAAIEEQVDAIDDTIKSIRTAVFALGTERRGKALRVRDRLLDVVSELSDGLESTPRITFSGALDALVPPALADDLVAVLRECLSNAARHAAAGAVDITVGLENGIVTIVVEDDGPGMPDHPNLSGLANMDERARLRGGGFTVSPRIAAGTRAEWSAPVEGTASEIA